MLFITNNSIKYHSFVYTKLNDQTVLFLTIQFSISFVCIQFKGSDGNERVLPISQNSSITGASPSDRLVSYLQHLSHPSAEMQTVSSTTPADRAKSDLNQCKSKSTITLQLFYQLNDNILTKCLESTFFSNVILCVIIIVTDGLPSKIVDCFFLFGVYGISTFVGYLMPNLFLYK